LLYGVPAIAAFLKVR